MAELKTFLFTDICRSVDLKNEMVGRSVTERDLAFIESILTPHRQRIEANMETCGGRVVSTAGDGHFLVFANTIQAAQWAVEVQESHRDQPIITPGGGRVEVRISIHVGVPQVDPADPDNFVGKTVDYASRLNDYASGGQILVSRSVMAILDDIGLEGIKLYLHGRRQLKGIGRVEVHELIYEETGPRTMRRQPASHHSDRQWTVVPATILYDNADPIRGALSGSSGSGSGGSLADVESPPLKRVGNYELEELIGSGGMGDVYKARHIQFGRARAVKVIKHQYVAAGHQEVIRRFYHEIKAIGALEHKNIVVAIDSSSPEDRIHYLVMEYIDGVGLHELIEQHGPLAPADACEVIRQAARGLQYIHRNQMVHRDLKPSNLMLTLVDGEEIEGNHPLSDSSVVGQPCHNATHGVVKILDLGLALLAAEQGERLTRFDNKAMGTGMYMSPEQWKTTSVDIRADIYSLGCTLYHLLSGNPPFYDSDLKPEKAHEKSRVPPIRSGPQIPRKLWDVIRKMLAKNPADRFQTPAEVSAALAPLTEGHNLVRLVKEFCEADSELASETRTKPESATARDTQSKTSSTLSTIISTRPSRRLILWTMGTALFGFIGLSGYTLYRHAINEPYIRIRDHLVTLPGLNGGWWFHEIPWFTPYVRERLLTSIKESDRKIGDKSLLDFGNLLYGDQVTKLYNELKEITDSLDNKLDFEEGDTVREEVSRLVYEAVLARGKPHSHDYEKGLQEALVSLFYLVEEKKTKAADLHLIAVLHHALAQWDQAGDYYFKAMNAYGTSSQMHVAASNDYSRMLLDSKRYSAAMDRFGREFLNPANQHWKVLAACLQAEAAYRRPGASSDPTLQQPRKIIEDAWKSSELPSNHPLHAYLSERQGWILNEAWQFKEAIKAFDHSKAIIAMQMSLPEATNPYLAELEIWARQGEATATNFSKESEAAVEIYKTLVDEIDATLNNRDDAPDRFKNLPQSQRQRMRERLPSICLRLGDCFLLSQQPDYAAAAEWYRRCITECEDLRWEQTDRRANYVIDWRYKQCLPAILSRTGKESIEKAEDLYAEASEHEAAYLKRQKDWTESPSTSFQFSKDLVRTLIDMASESAEVRSAGFETLLSQVMQTETAKLGRHHLGTFALAVEQLAQSDLKNDPKRLRELASHVNDVFVVYRKTEELQPYLQRSMHALLQALKKSYEETQDIEIQRQLKNIDSLILKSRYQEESGNEEKKE